MRANLVAYRLEGISKDIFKKYYDVITELIGSSPGIYALYDEGELYYVGKSTELRKRVKNHLRDRHLASWTHLSLYLVRKAERIHEIESLLIRITNPKGNRATPKGMASGKLLKKLREMIKAKQKQELNELFGGKKARQRQVKQRDRNIEGLVSRRTKITKTYKGKEYTAYLYPSGTITTGKKKFTSPTAAAKSIVKRPTVNGWSFWFIRDSNGDWVKLKNY